MPFPFAGELASLVTSLLFSIGPTFFTLSGRLVGSAVINRGRLLAAALTLMLVHLVAYGSLIPDASGQQWLWLGLSGVIGLSLGDAALFQALVQIGPRLTMLVFSLSPILAALAGWLWHGEMLTATQMLGIGVTLAGVLWVVSERQSGPEQIEPKVYASGLFFAFLGAVGQAGGLITAKEGLAGDFPVLSGQVIRMGVAAAALWATTLATGKAGKTILALRENPLAVRFMLLGTLFGPVLGVWFSLAAVKYTADIGVASTLQSLPPIFLIPIGYIFFKESVSRRAIVGTAAALLGVAILFLA